VLDFNLTDPETGETLNDSLLQRKGVQFFLIMYDIDKAERDVMGKVNAFYADAAKAGTPFYALSNASLESANAFRKETGAKYPMLSVDGTALKTAIRSNPGLMMLKDGVVTDMWHANDFPAYSDAMAEHK
jgi:peroxiredoxin